MSQDIIACLVERVEQLERENAALHRARRRWKKTGWAVFLSMTALVVVGAQLADVPKTLVVQGLSLQDKSGAQRATFGVGDDGFSYLKLTGEKGRAGVSLRSGNNGEASVSLVDQRGRERLVLGLRQDGEPTVELRNEKGHIRFSVGKTDQQSMLLAVFDEEARRRFGILVQPDGESRLDLTDQNGMSRIALIDREKSGPRIGMADCEGFTRVFARLDPGGEPALALFGPKGEGSVMLRVPSDADSPPLIHIIDRTRKLVFAVPLKLK